MCGCRKRNRVAVQKIVAAGPPKDLVRVTTSTPEPVYGCVTGTRYAFHIEDELYVDQRDAKCLSENFTLWE